MDKRGLSERDICTKFIAPALVAAGWDIGVQVREEVSFTNGRITVRGKLVTRGNPSSGSRRLPPRSHSRTTAHVRQLRF